MKNLNNLKLTGYFNNIKEIGIKTKVANFSYSIKNKKGQYENIFIEVYFSKNLEVEEHQKYIINGFLVGDIWNDKITGKERNVLKIRINSIEKYDKKYKNIFNITGYVSNFKKISDNINIFRLSYPIKLKDNSKKYIYIDALINKSIEIQEKTEYDFTGFFTGKVWDDKYTNKKRKKIQFFIIDIKEKNDS